MTLNYFFSYQTKIELLVFFYTAILAVYSLGIILMKVALPEHFNSCMKVLSGVYYVIAFIGLVMASLLKDAVVPPFSYHLYILASAIICNNLLIKGLLHIKIGDYEIGTDMSEILISNEKFIKSADNINSVYPLAVQVITDLKTQLTHLPAGQRDLAHMEVFLQNLFLTPEIVNLFNCQFKIDYIADKNIAKNYIRNLSNTKKLWYNKSTIDKAVKSLYDNNSYPLSTKLQLFMFKVNGQDIILVADNSDEFYTPQISFIYSIFHMLSVELEWTDV